MSNLKCSFCGKAIIKSHDEHIFPNCIYPPSKDLSKEIRLKIPACLECNSSWSGDEEFFRNVIYTAVGHNPNMDEKLMFEGPIIRSIRDHIGGKSKLDDLFEVMKSVVVDGDIRQIIYPTESNKILRVVRKMICGLCSHHLRIMVADDNVQVDMLDYYKDFITQKVLDAMNYNQIDKDIVEYWYSELDHGPISSLWVLRFLTKIEFISFVMR